MTDVTRKRRKLLPEMEGPMARWYARNRGSAQQMRAYRRQAARHTEGLPDRAEVLEVAPGPGYHAVELARTGRVRVTGLDVSRTMVQIATEYARREGVTVDFRRGDVAAMPFPAESFNLVVCQAAFKNFADPARALAEMYRVLRPGGTAVIEDLRADATAAEIADEIRDMGATGPNALFARAALRMLRRRAHPAAEFHRLAAASPFGGCRIVPDGIGMQVRLTRRPDPRPA